MSITQRAAVIHARLLTCGDTGLEVMKQLIRDNALRGKCFQVGITRPGSMGSKSDCWMWSSILSRLWADQAETQFSIVSALLPCSLQTNCRHVTNANLERFTQRHSVAWPPRLAGPGRLAC